MAHPAPTTGRELIFLLSFARWDHCKQLVAVEGVVLNYLLDDCSFVEMKNYFPSDNSMCDGYNRFSNIDSHKLKTVNPLPLIAVCNLADDGG